MYAFWHYEDTYLGGEVARTGRDVVYVNAYQNWFKPAFVVTDDALGASILADLKSARAGHDAAVAALNVAYRDQVKSIVSRVIGD